MRPSRPATALVALLAAGCGGPTSPPPPPPPATIASITLTAATPTMAPGATQALTAVARNAAGQPVSTSFTWTSTVPGVATVNGSGMVTAVAPGSTAVTAASGAITSNAVALSVEPATALPARVEIDRSALLLPGIGQSTRLTARAFDAQGAPTAATITWTSSAPADVSVDPTGLVTAVRIGSAEIYATAEGVRSPATIAYVAEPATGALLVSDAQVVSVGPPLDLAPDATPTVGTEYEVRLRNLPTAPAAGTT
ncbi:MAG: Ig-like domain-containing protein, partial [Gemmatimonadales bacterium]